MVLAEPFYADREHFAIDLPGGRALFTTRRGGVSIGPYASLNLGRWTNDDPAAVAHNRQLVQERLSVRFAYGRQVHGSSVSVAAGPVEDGELPAEADGQVSATRGVAPMVLTADCLPVALAAPGAVAMIHAGWRGLAAGVLAAGVRAVLAQAQEKRPLVAAIGPGAGGCCYEVGEEVHSAFAAYEAQARRGNNIDLKTIARAQLAHAGADLVHDIGLCTICAPPELFFSHRRDAGVTGRQAGVAWLT